MAKKSVLQGAYLELYSSRRTGQYSWRLKAANHEKIAIAGESYEKKSHAIKMAEELFPSVPVKDLTNKKK